MIKQGICLDVEYVDCDDEYFYDLEVEDTHNYFANNCIVHNCGSGKTITLISMISMCRQPSLIIVPDIALQQQWLENIENVLGIKYNDRESLIGLVGDGHYEYKNKWIVIAINASIYTHRDDKEFFKSFGFVCMDECHSVGSRTFRTSIHMFPAYYRFGATATLFRTDNLSNFIEDYIGKCFYTVTDEELEESGLLIKPKLVKRNTNFNFKVNFKYKNWYNTMVKYLMSNMARNKLIANDIVNLSVYPNRIALVVTTRVSHCIEMSKLLQKLVPKIKIGILVGSEIKGNLNYNNIVTYKVEEKARKGELDVIFGVNKVKQGLDIPPIEDVYLIAPKSSEVDITQIVGRAMRPSDCFGKYKNKSDKEPIVYDYVDYKVEVLLNQYKEHRLPIYEKRCIIEKSKKGRNTRNEHDRQSKSRNRSTNRKSMR